MTRTRAARKDRACGVVVVGSGLRFLSGISVYTHQLVTHLGRERPTAAVLVRDLVPKRLYPGRRRVGRPLSSLTYDGVPHVEIDWHWGSLPRTLRFLRRRNPDTLILQWWTAATGHTYLALALWARVRGVTVITEFHEVQDPGEASNRWRRSYGTAMVRAVGRLSHGVLVHHAHDLDLIQRAVRMDGKPVRQAVHPPYTYLTAIDRVDPPELDSADRSSTRFLLFGIMRPRKGVEVVLDAFRSLPTSVAADAQLLLVGECWEGLASVMADARQGRNGDRVTVIDRYVSDEEAAAVFRAADVVLLPYLESSSSGPLAIAMGFGLPVVMSDLPSLRASAGSYPGVTLATAGDAGAWCAALQEMACIRHRSRSPLTPTQADWSPLLAAYEELREAAQAHACAPKVRGSLSDGEIARAQASPIRYRG